MKSTKPRCLDSAVPMMICGRQGGGDGGSSGVPQVAGARSRMPTAAFQWHSHCCSEVGVAAVVPIHRTLTFGGSPTMVAVPPMLENSTYMQGVETQRCRL